MILHPVHPGFRIAVPGDALHVLSHAMHVLLHPWHVHLAALALGIHGPVSHHWALAESLARRIEAAFDTVIPANAYTVKLDDDGDLYWLERDQGETHRYESEPATSVWRRSWVRFVSWLPVEWLL